MILLLDAANTIIYKPNFYFKFVEVLKQHNIIVEREDFHRLHKTISECYLFPDRTSKSFYEGFNKEVLYALGIIASNELLEDLYKECSYLEWDKFEDTMHLSTLNCKIAVLSNFHNGLNEILKRLFSIEFISLTISENEKVRKPEAAFFETAIRNLGVKPSEIVYIGDSIKLDLEPGLKSGMNSWLIDRNNYYPYCERRLNSLEELKNVF